MVLLYFSPLVAHHLHGVMWLNMNSVNLEQNAVGVNVYRPHPTGINHSDHPSGWFPWDSDVLTGCPHKNMIRSEGLGQLQFYTQSKTILILIINILSFKRYLFCQWRFIWILSLLVVTTHYFSTRNGLWPGGNKLV